MYHELLLVLMGYPGKWLSKEQNMVDLANFYNPSEKSLVRQILDVAQEHSQLKQFIKDYGRHKAGLHPNGGVTTNGTQTTPGLYMQAFCEGLDEALDCYRAGVEAMECAFLKDPQCNLTHIFSFASKYKDFLSALNIIVQEIKVKKVHGCLLLQLLHNHSSTKFDGVKEAVMRMMQECHSVFFKQVTNWVLFGQLTDEFEEFFIKSVQESTEEGTESLGYELRPEMIPSYISPSLAHKILFVGQTILIIGRDPNEQCIERVRSSRMISGEEVWGGCGKQFFDNLDLLHTSPVLDLQLFDDSISLIMNCVTERFWVLAVEKAGLRDQLRLIRDMFLLSRGELFHEFIQEAQSVLDRPVNKNFSREINQAFHTAAHKILVTSEEAKMDKFYFTSTAVEGGNGWSSLVLQYKAEWPLHLLFSPSVLDCYNQLFSFLLRVKKTQRQLHRLWRDQMVNKSTNWRESSVWRVRSSLMFLVDHLQYYLQVDVLESQWSALQAAFKSTRDFETLRRAHATFLATTLSQTFLLLGFKKGEPDTTAYYNPESLKNNMVHKKLSDLLRLCEQFCNMVTVWGSQPSSEQTQQLEPLCEELDNVMNCLLHLLSSLRSQPCGVHLAQLLLRLDFNRWFSVHRGVTSMTSSFI